MDIQINYEKNIDANAYMEPVINREIETFSLINYNESGIFKIRPV